MCSPDVAKFILAGNFRLLCLIMDFDVFSFFVYCICDEYRRIFCRNLLFINFGFVIGFSLMSVNGKVVRSVTIL